MQIKISKKHSAILTAMPYMPIAVIIWISTMWSSVQAQTNATIHEVTTAIPLLRMSPDARSASLGETSLATSPDAASGMFNTAKSVFTKKQTNLIINYAPWLGEITSDSYLLSLAGYHKLDDRQTITSSLRYFNSGKVEERDFNNNLVQLITPTEFVIDAGYARMLSDKISVGLTFRYINSSIGKTVSNASGNSNAFAADLSAYYNNHDEEGRGLTAGMIIANIGTGKISYGQGDYNDGFLPARVGLGLGYTVPLINEDRISITGEFNKSLVPLMPVGDDGYKEFMNYSVLESYGKGLGNDALNFSAGAEYMYQDLLGLRAGYFTESQAFGGRSYVSVGAGVYYQNIGLDLAYIVPSGSGINRNALSNTLRLGVSFEFSGK